MDRACLAAFAVSCSWAAGAQAASTAGRSGARPALDLSQYAHKAWSVGEGALNGGVRAIVQSRDGYLWLGTEFGLLRFDGVQTVAWQPPGPERLPSNYVRSLLAARDGTLWIGTLEGLAGWKDGRLTLIAELAGQNVLSLLEDREGTVWAGTFGVPAARLCAIRAGQVSCSGGDGRFGQWVSSSSEDGDGRLWLGTESGLWRWKPDPPERYALEHPIETTQAIAGGSGGELIFATHGLWRFADGGIERHHVLPEPFTPLNLLRDHGGGLWIGTIERGLVREQEGRISVFGKGDGLSSDRVLSLFEDREGNVWAGTADGLDRFRELAIPSISVKQGLSSPIIMSVLAGRDGSIWLSTLAGLNRWKAGTVTVWRAGRGGARRVRKLDRGGIEITDPELPDDQVGSLFEDDRGRIWVSTPGEVARLEQDRFSRVEEVPRGWVNAIVGDSRGAVWISYQDHGLVRWSDGKVTDRIPWSRFGGKTVASTLLPDPARGGLWLGFFEGGVKYLEDGEVRASYGKAEGLGAGRVMGLQRESDGTIWAATEGGLSRLKDGRATTLTSANGLRCDGVHWAIDAGESFWLYTPCGLLRIERGDLARWVSNPASSIQPRIFDAADGVRSHALLTGYTPRVTRSPDGRLWFAHFENASVVDPAHLTLNEVPPPVYVERITADGRTHDAAGPLTLPPLVRNLAIDYTALSFAAPEKVRFRFRLEGQDDGWREVINDRRIEYSNLRPGGYRFFVTASNESGVWNEQGASFAFSIAPAWHQTSWFRALAAAAVLALLWTVFHLRVRAVERRRDQVRTLNEQLVHAQEEERARIAGELHDGIAQQIATASLLLGVASRHVPSDSKPKATLAEVEEKLVEIGIDIRHLSHELHPGLIEQSGLPVALRTYCSEFSKSRGIPVVCSADPEARDLPRATALCIYRIAQEALGNVAKHASAKQTIVELRRVDWRVRLSVSDDGVGCTPGKTGGLGLINMRERVVQLDGTFEVESAPGHGTTVRVAIPVRPT